MNSKFIFLFLIYFIVISVVSTALTVIDKKRAVKGKWRISEKVLIITALFGGGLFELITMKLIRHKTKKPLFMVGLPIIIFLHIFVITAFLISKAAF